MKVYPEAKVERKHNDIELTLPVVTENLEVAAFRLPKKKMTRNECNGDLWKRSHTGLQLKDSGLLD